MCNSVIFHVGRPCSRKCKKIFECIITYVYHFLGETLVNKGFNSEKISENSEIPR